MQDGTDASDAGYAERFVRVATLQERHRAAQRSPAPPRPHTRCRRRRRRRRPAKGPSTRRGQRPRTRNGRRRGAKSSSSTCAAVVPTGELRDCPILAKSDARAHRAGRRRAGHGRGVSATMARRRSAARAREALRLSLDGVSIATVRKCVVELRRLSSKSAGVDERRLALSGAHFWRGSSRRGASSRRRALESKPRCY